MHKKLKVKIKDMILPVSKAGKTVVNKTIIKPVGKAGKIASKVSKKISQSYDKSTLKPKVDKTVASIDGTLEKTGIKSKAKKAKHVTTKHFDTFTGTRQYRLMQERMALQQRYNDILATKLEEALQRIGHLENLAGIERMKGRKKWTLKNLRKNIKIPRKFL